MGIFLPIFVDDSAQSVEDITEKMEFYKNKSKQLELNNKEKTAFEELSEKVNADEKGITKQDLKEYLNMLLTKEDDEKDKDELPFLINLIADFDNITGGKKHMISFTKDNEFVV